MHASPATSGIELPLKAITGHPDDIASSTGRPNPRTMRYILAHVHDCIDKKAIDRYLK